MYHLILSKILTKHQKFLRNINTNNGKTDILLSNVIILKEYDTI